MGNTHQTASKSYVLKRPWYNHDDKLIDVPSAVWSWMKGVPDTMLTSCLAIPGTHDSCALYGTQFAECQSLSLWSQLQGGIRWLDIRCRWYKDGLPIHHEIIYQKLNFNDVLLTVTKFLRTYPSEGVFISIMQEYDAADNSANTTFEGLVTRYCDPYADFFLDKSKTDPPTMKEMRGKILVFKRFDGDFGYGAIKMKEDLGDCYDNYKIFDYNQLLTEKIPAVKDFLKRDKKKEKFNVLFLSGNTWHYSPCYQANAINETIGELCKNDKDLAKNCIVAMDYPGLEMINTIIHSNFA